MSEPRIVSQAPSRVAKLRPATTVAPIPLSEHVNVVIHYRALVLMVAATVSLGGAFYAYSKSPVYEGNLLVSVSDDRSYDQRTLLGSPALNAERRTAMSETEVLRSRAVLGKVIDDLHLDIVASPKYFPYIGRALANWNLFHLPFGGYAWGGERIDVDSFEVPPALQDATFVVTRRDGGAYELSLRDAGIRAEGRIGQPLLLHTAAGDVRLSIDELYGRSGTQFRLKKKPRALALKDLGTAMSVQELGKDSGMLNVSYADSNPEMVQAVLKDVGKTYTDFITRQKTEQSTQSVKVLQDQIPGLKERVRRAASDYETYRRTHHTVDLAEETKLRLGRISANREQLAELRQKRAEMADRLGDQHPLLHALDQQIRAAEQEGGAVSSEIRSYPAVATDLERLSRNLQNETEIYNTVERKLAEMQVIAQDRSSNVKVVDEPIVPYTPKGSRATILAFFIAIGVFLGIFSAFLKRMFFQTANY
jgi:tyrosine-protein kinase Etk/Wzc